jgi:hypothetical protein
VRTLDSAGKTPIITRDVPSWATEQPQANARIASYLNNIDPSVHPDHTPFTQDVSADENEELGEPSSRKTSTSMVKVVTTAVKDLELAGQNKAVNEKLRWLGRLDHVDELEAPKNLSEESKDTSADTQGDGIRHRQDVGLAKGRDEEVYSKGKGNSFSTIAHTVPAQLVQS